jgi:hypothetical protein
MLERKMEADAMIGIAQKVFPAGARFSCAALRVRRETLTSARFTFKQGKLAKSVMPAFRGEPGS